MRELTILNENVIRQRHQNLNLLEQICSRYRKQEIERETKKEEVRSALLGTVLAFFICAFFIAYWLLIGY